MKAGTFWSRPRMNYIKDFNSPWGVNIRVLLWFVNLFPPVVFSWLLYLSGTKGYEKSCSSCPVAIFLKKFLPKKFKVGVMAYDISVRYRKTKDKPLSIAHIYFDNGENLRKYVTDFDKGLFPRNSLGEMHDPSSPVVGSCLYNT